MNGLHVHSRDGEKYISKRFFSRKMNEARENRGLLIAEKSFHAEVFMHMHDVRQRFAAKIIIHNTYVTLNVMYMRSFVIFTTIMQRYLVITQRISKFGVI